MGHAWKIAHIMSLSAVRFGPTRSCMQWILNPFCKHLGRLTTADLWLLRAMKFRCENACCAAIVFCCVGNEIGTRDGTRTRNLLLRREAPYPLSHTSCCNMHKRANDHFRHRRATAGRGGRPCKGQRQRLQTRRRQQVPRWVVVVVVVAAAEAANAAAAPVAARRLQMQWQRR